MSVATCYALAAAEEALCQANWKPHTEGDKIATGKRYMLVYCLVLQVQYGVRIEALVTENILYIYMRNYMWFKLFLFCLVGSNLVNLAVLKHVDGW